jgi:hypothetical protein
MSDSTRDGGPAFPLHPGILAEWKQSAGMTLRDYFAAQALAAFALDMSDSEITFDDVASNAYRLADSMLKAREASNV